MAKCKNCPNEKLAGMGRHLCQACSDISKARIKRKDRMRYRAMIAAMTEEEKAKYWEGRAALFRERNYPKNSAERTRRFRENNR